MTDSQRERVVVGRLEVRDHEVAANGVGIDGTIQMPSAIEVIGETQSEAVAQIALQGEVRLLRVGVDKVLRLRIAKGLESQRQERRGIQVVLVQKNRLRKVQGLKLLLVGQETKR